MEPLRGKTSSFAVSTQGCEYATLGFEIQPLRGKDRQKIVHGVALRGRSCWAKGKFIQVCHLSVPM